MYDPTFWASVSPWQPSIKHVTCVQQGFCRGTGEGLEQFSFSAASFWAFWKECGRALLLISPQYIRINLVQTHALLWLRWFQKQVALQAGIPSAFSHPIFKAWQFWNLSKHFPSLPLIHKYHISSKLLKLVSVVKKPHTHPNWPSFVVGLGHQHRLPAESITAKCKSAGWAAVGSWSILPLQVKQLNMNIGRITLQGCYGMRAVAS